MSEQNSAATAASSAFAQLSLQPALLDNLQSLEYREMTPIQAQSLPAVLAGKDVLAQAKTGSGKTAAFALGLLQKLDVKSLAVQGLVLCPTRELADQVAGEIRRLARLIPNVKVLTLCGGMPINPQFGSLEQGAHIVVGTPGRVQKHLDKESLSLDSLKIWVLDEADRMLDMGFADAMRDIAKVCPRQRQTLLFSATYPQDIQQLSAEFQRDPLSVRVESTHSAHQIEQRFFELPNQEAKFPALIKLLQHYQPRSAVIFCNMKQQTQLVADQLKAKGYSALALHGDLEQRERDQVVVRFANQSCSVLVATDVAARGLDIKELQAVVNYDITPDPEVHVHRIGRTGRAGQTGLALTLTTATQGSRVVAVEDYQQSRAVWGDLDALKKNPDNMKPDMVTLCIDGGRKSKVRPGDILGALTKEAGFNGQHIGKINIAELHAYVAVHHSIANKAYSYLQDGKIKGRKVKVRKLV
ncbi:ATP-dependent RNA helicase DbpA [Tolumonas osonensis]|uniref:ATP-independent RNA helicase DbpA n=1 Tax=Tolumonas osonensis TaxID=675874 RepID=A0A841GPX0_9GAMM|nr:ATP-dependent RNA helicase DbpA [Tolumonas osonensis]MBB6056950.1 ATP-independent RNA helicase DbpA [Tolumonas osonensis]